MKVNDSEWELMVEHQTSITPVLLKPVLETQTITDKHMHWRVGTPGKIHNMLLHVDSVRVTYMVIRVGAVEPTHGCTPCSRHVWLLPSRLRCTSTCTGVSVKCASRQCPPSLSKHAECAVSARGSILTLRSRPHRLVAACCLVVPCCAAALRDSWPELRNLERGVGDGKSTASRRGWDKRGFQRMATFPPD